MTARIRWSSSLVPRYGWSPSMKLTQAIEVGLNTTFVDAGAPAPSSTLTVRWYGVLIWPFAGSFGGR